ncbi:hypothetical protein LTR17_006626 [Elasticomyces elasticus]|nr:hypothetical protein LTR17_006626 [Elasticomyces elasticus]
MLSLSVDHGELPEEFYRVQYHGSTIKSPSDGSGLLAADIRTIYNEKDIEGFRQSVINQFTWKIKNHVKTPYVSVFVDREHAENWARRMGESTSSSEIKLFIIDTSLLSTQTVYRLETLVKRLNICENELEAAAWQHEYGAHMVLHHIPLKAIKESRDFGQILYDIERRRERKAAFRRLGIDDDTLWWWHYDNAVRQSQEEEDVLRVEEARFEAACEECYYDAVGSELIVPLKQQSLHEECLVDVEQKRTAMDLWLQRGVHQVSYRQAVPLLRD